MKQRILFLTCLIISFSIFGQENGSQGPDMLKNYPLPTVDKRVELLSIVFRLAGSYEYNNDAYRSYVSDIHRHFDKYKDHPVIAFATKLSNDNGVAFDAVMCMAIYLSQPPDLAPIVPFSSIIPEKRWGMDNAGKFAALLKQFYKDAKCEEFFTAHQELYEVAAGRFLPVYNALDIHWYNTYYGTLPEGSLNCVVGLGLGGGNYGVKVKHPEGYEDSFSIMGVAYIDTTDKPFFAVPFCLPTLIHEFNHSFVNHLTQKFEKDFESSGKKIFQLVKSSMACQHYNNWQTMLNEALVRASVIRYMMDHGDAEAAKNQLKSEFGNGFFWMKGLVESLGAYEKNRETYPTLESYMPVLIGFYGNVTVEIDSMFDIKE